MVTWASEYDRLAERITAHGVAVRVESLGDGIPGAFDGVSITTNSAWDPETRCYVLAHCFGHTVQWSLDFARYDALYRELAVAKVNKEVNPVALQRALDDFRRYEEQASEYGAWIFASSPEASAAFANFARADIEAIVTFHRDGSAPPWGKFFADWNEQVAREQRPITPFRPRPVPCFRPVHLPRQEVIQMPMPADC